MARRSRRIGLRWWWRSSPAAWAYSSAGAGTGRRRGRSRAGSRSRRPRSTGGGYARGPGPDHVRGRGTCGRGGCRSRRRETRQGPVGQPAEAGDVMADLAAPLRYYIDRAHSGAGGPGARSCVAERRQRGTRKDTTDDGGGRVNAHPGRQSHPDGVVEITFRGVEQQGWSISSDASNRFELECPHGKFRFRWPEALAPRELRADVFRRMNDEHRRACPAS